MKLFGLLLLSYLLITGNSFADDGEQKIKMKDVPVAVKKGVKSWIKSNAKGAKIEEIEVEFEDGKKVYEFEIEAKDGKEYEVEVGEDGKILEVEEDDDEDNKDDDDS